VAFQAMILIGLFEGHGKTPFGPHL